MKKMIIAILVLAIVSSCAVVGYACGRSGEDMNDINERIAYVKEHIDAIGEMEVERTLAYNTELGYYEYDLVGRCGYATYICTRVTDNEPNEYDMAIFDLEFMEFVLSNVIEED